MHCTRVLGGFAGAAVLALSGGAAAQSESNGSIDERLRQMQKELEAVRADNERMRGELDELRAATDEDWLTEQRADEIRALVADVLADADTRSSLLQDGLTAGWSDGFFLTSPDGRFKLQLEGQIQTRYIWNYHDQIDRHRNGWEITRTRLTFRGHVFSPDVNYLLRIGHTRQEPGLVDGIGYLFDAWVRVNLNNETSIRVGQYKIPFMREELVDSSRQLAVERSLINQSLSVDRSQGLELALELGDGLLRIGTFDAGLDQIGFGLIGTEPVGVDSAWSVEDTEYTIAGRYEHLLAGTWGQFEDFTSPPGDDFGLLLGFAGFFQQDERTGRPEFLGRDEVDWAAYTVDVSAEWGGANAFLSFTHHYIDTRFFTGNIFGVVAQGGMYLTPKLEAYARFEYGWWHFDNNSLADLTVVTVGANYYLDGHDLKWTTDLGWGISKIESNWASDIAGWRGENDGSEPQVVFRTQFQLLF